MAGVKSYQLPAVIQSLTERYGGSKLSQKAAMSSVVTQKDPLAHLVAWQRTHYPQAWVASTFYDYRTTSRYRRHAGLHLGYDIAMPYGTAVSAAWAGKVTDIIPWSATEYGVSITDSLGNTVTYGHIRPTVQIGQSIKEGDIIARIEYDHVDVKMRDASGQYVAFGENSKANSTPALASSTPVVDRKALLTAWLAAKTAADTAQEELFLKINASRKLEIEKRSAQRKVQVLESTLKELSLPENTNLVSRKKLEELKSELSSARKDITRLKAENKTSQTELERRVKQRQADLKAFETWAKSEGLDWKDVENLVAQTIAKDANLTETVIEAKTKRSLQDGLTLHELETRRDEGRRQLAKLEELFAAGGMSLREITDERLRQELLEEEFALKKAHP